MVVADFRRAATGRGRPTGKQSASALAFSPLPRPCSEDYLIGQGRHSANPLPKIHSWSPFEYPISCVNSVTACW
jgi:hypothetical protein